MSSGNRRSLYRDTSLNGEVKGHGPSEDEHGNRLHSAAGQAVNQTFGGLPLGFSGGPDADLSPPPDGPYRNLLFKPGTNLGPMYPDDFRMTSACLPSLVRRGDPRLKLMVAGDKVPQLGAVFSPPNSAAQGPLWKRPSPTAGPKPWDPCMDWIPECPGEDGAGYGVDYPNKMFLFFGPPADPPRPPFCPPTVETTEEAVYDYFDSHNIDSLMEYLLTLIFIHAPDDPFHYIQDICDRMIRSRGDTSELERLDTVFEPSHLLAMFSLFDKEERKYISIDQYRNAMEMLGLSRYNPQPIGFKEDVITEDVFFEETTKALALLVQSFTG